MFGTGFAGCLARLGVSLVAVSFGMFLSDRLEGRYSRASGPVREAFNKGAGEMREIMQSWNGSVSPDSYKVECPFDSETQGELCRAFRAGALCMQAQIVEEFFKSM